MIIPVEINVTELRRGMVIVENRRTIPVKSITGCTQRGKVHVNDTLCYDLCGKVTIASKES